MILYDEIIEIFVGSRNLEKVRQYYPAERNTYIKVSQKHALEISKTSYIKCKCDSCGTLYEILCYRLFEKEFRQQYCGLCRSKIGRDNMIETTRSDVYRQGKREEVISYHERNKVEIIINGLDVKQYSYEVRKVTKRTYCKYKNIINPTQHPISRYEYHVDHIIPVKYGFYNNIEIELISHYLNLRVLKCSENLQRRFVEDNEDEYNILLEKIKAGNPRPL